MSDAALSGSGGADSSILIECSPVAIEEIRRQVVRGAAQTTRGYLEVGGVFYGTREGGKVRIETVRPIDAEVGPSFSLSDADRAKLQAQIAQAATDPRLEKFVCLGWFVSHSGPEMTLTEADVEIFSTYFPEPWQVTLVINPQRGAMKGGFFVREPDGTIQANKIFKQFHFPDRLAGVLQTAAPSRSETRPISRAPQQFPAPERIERARSPLSPVGEGAGYYPDPVPPRKIWPWIVGGVAIVIALVLLGFQFWQGSEPESLRLIVTEKDGQLQIEWNSTMRAVARASGGSLNILDGSTVEHISLSRTQLGEGRYMYTRKNGDVEVRMEVDSDGDTVRESSRFLGRAPIAAVPESATRVDEGRTASPASDAAANDSEKAALVEENKRIRLENAVLKERVQQLERVQKILETRLGITGKE